MNTAEEVLVAILAAALAVLLILAIAIAIQILKLIKSLREVAHRAERVIDSAEAIGHVFRRVSGPVSLMQFARTVFDSVSEHKQKNKGE